MNDPHVQSLTYDLVTEPPHPYEDFSKVEPLKAEFADFDCTLAGSKLTVLPREHYANASSAQLVLEPRLRDWELRAEVEQGIRMEFRFSDAIVIDRHPNDEGTGNVVGQGALAVHAIHVSAAASVSRQHERYPDPPSAAFQMTALLAQLSGYLREWRRGRSRLLVAAQLVLTRLQEFGGPLGEISQRRTRAAQKLNVDRRVLDRLGGLANRNDPVHGRKAEGPERPLTQEELHWVCRALTKLIMRAAEVGPDGGLAPERPYLTLADFDS